MKIMEFDPKWVHMAGYELILRLDRALWLRIISPKAMLYDWSWDGGTVATRMCLGPGP